MLTKDVLDFFGGSRKKIADTLGIKRASVYQWGDQVPPLRAAQLHRITLGKLCFEPEEYAGYWQKGKDGAAAAH
jgi:DNA-binding transcriptional regulator YdaS (Cro superfamily)